MFGDVMENDGNSEHGTTLVDNGSEDDVEDGIHSVRFALPETQISEKALRAQIKLKQKQEFKKQMIRDELKRELELSRRTYFKNISRWEDMCKEVKLKELNNEVEFSKEQFERISFMRDDRINFLLEYINETYELKRRNFSKHVSILDYLTAFFNATKDALKLEYEAKVSELLNVFSEEKGLMGEGLASLRDTTDKQISATTILLNSIVDTRLQNYIFEVNDIVLDEISRRHFLRDKFIKQMKEMYTELCQFTDNLKNDMLDVNKHQRIGTLMRKQRAFAEEIERLTEDEIFTTRQLVALRRTYTLREANSNRRISDLLLELKYFIGIRKGLEEKISNHRNLTVLKLSTSSNASFRITKRLNRIIKFGELLLTTCGSCRKFETQQAKIVFYQNPYENPNEETEIFKLKTLDLATHLDVTEEEIIEQIEIHKNFWRRECLVEMQNELLLEDKNQLVTENDKFIEKIKAMSTRVDIPTLKLGILSDEFVEEGGHGEAESEFLNCHQFKLA